MKEPTTIKGYIKLIKFIDKITITDKKGFDKLSQAQKNALYELSAEISNRIEDIEGESNLY